jgi:hypothetical protein
MRTDDRSCRIVYLDRDSVLRDLDTGRPARSKGGPSICLLDRRDYSLRPVQDGVIKDSTADVPLSPPGIPHDHAEYVYSIVAVTQTRAGTLRLPRRRSKRIVDRRNHIRFRLYIRKDILSGYRRAAGRARLLPAFLLIPREIPDDAGTTSIILPVGECAEVLEFSNGVFTGSRSVSANALPFCGLSGKDGEHTVLVTPPQGFSDRWEPVLTTVRRSASESVSTMSTRELVGTHRGLFRRRPDATLATVILTTFILGSLLLPWQFCRIAPIEPADSSPADGPADGPSEAPETHSIELDPISRSGSLRSALTAWIAVHPTGARATSLSFDGSRFELILEGAGLFGAVHGNRDAEFFERYRLESLASEDGTETMRISWQWEGLDPGRGDGAVGRTAGNRHNPENLSTDLLAAVPVEGILREAGIGERWFTTPAGRENTLSAGGTGSPTACAVVLEKLDATCRLTAFRIHADAKGQIDLEFQSELPNDYEAVDSGESMRSHEISLSDAFAILFHATRDETVDRFVPSRPPPPRQTLDHVATIRTDSDDWFFLAERRSGTILAVPNVGRSDSGLRAREISETMIIVEGEGERFSVERRDR